MKRFKAYLLVALSYAVGFAAAFFVFEAIAGSALPTEGILIALAVLAADAVATVVVWLFGIIFKNSSFYDPYWSLTPFVIILFLMIKFSHFGALNIIFLCVIGFWSWRLTFNWAYTFKDISVQDWRYDKYKSENGVVMWHIINFMGINMVPTLFVYLGLLPAIFLVLENAAFGLYPMLGAVIIVLGTLCELFADLQQHSFRKKSADKLSVLDKGLWSISRHPNYLGEISIWLGVYLFMLPVLTSLWFLFIGFFGMVFLFMVVSIPLAEKRQLLRRPDYAEYQKNVSMLLPLPFKSKK